MSVEIKIPTIDGVVLKTKDTYVEDDIKLTVGIEHYFGDVEGRLITDFERMLRTELTELVSNSITYIGSPGLSKQPVTKVILPNLTSVTNDTFSACANLTEVYIPKLTRLGYNSFRGCSAIEVISLPKLTLMYSSVFYQCSKLKHIYFDSISNLGPSGIFEYCTNLSDVYLGYNGVVALGATGVLNSRDTATAQGYINVHVRPEYANSYTDATNWSTLIESGFVNIIGDYTPVEG